MVFLFNKAPFEVNMKNQLNLKKTKSPAKNTKINKTSKTKNTKTKTAKTKILKNAFKETVKEIKNIEIKKRAARKSRKSKFKSANSDLFYDFLYKGATTKPNLKVEINPKTLGFALANINATIHLKPNQGRPSHAKEENIDVNNIEYTEFLLINSNVKGEESITSRFNPSRNSIAHLIIKNDLKNLKKKVTKQNVNQREDKNLVSSFTPLYWAVKYKRLEAAEILLNSGANVNLVINDLEECCGTALDLACLRDDQAMEELLRKYTDKEKIDQNTSYRAIRSKLRGKSTPGFSFRYVAKQNKA